RAHARLLLEVQGKEELLPRLHDVAGQVVPLFQPVDRSARIAAVVRARDRPERVVPLDRVDPSVAGPVGRMRRDCPENKACEQDAYELDEHMFATLERTRVRVKSSRRAALSSAHRRSRAGGVAPPSAPRLSRPSPDRPARASRPSHRQMQAGGETSGAAKTNT